MKNYRVTSPLGVEDELDDLETCVKVLDIKTCFVGGKINEDAKLVIEKCLENGNKSYDGIRES